MHPFLAGRGRLGLYLSAWLVVATLLAALLYFSDPRPPVWIGMFVLPPVIVYAFACLSAWWVCKSLPLQSTPHGKLTAALAATAILTAAFWTGVARIWDRVLAGSGYPAVRATVKDYGVLFIAGIVLYVLSIAVHYLVLVFEASRNAERRAYEAEVTAREAQLRALRAQLNPHFLFNSLNSINALVGSSPESARRMCQGLGDFLRQTLNLGARETVTLSEELNLVENYLAIEKVRFGARLSVERVTDPDAESCLVPPLLLQPLVENAVKHGITERLEGGTIRLEAVKSGDTLRLTVDNPLDPDAPLRPGEGVGIDIVRRRLSALRGSARLDVSRTDSMFTVTLQLPALSGPAPADGRPATNSMAGNAMPRGAAPTRSGV